MGRNNEHLVDKLSFEDTAFTLTSSYNIQQTTTTNMVFGSRLSLSAMLALGLCLSQGTATEAAGITQLFNHAAADLVRRRSRTVCQQEFVLEPTLLISLL